MERLPSTSTIYMIIKRFLDFHYNIIKYDTRDAFEWKLYLNEAKKSGVLRQHFKYAIPIPLCTPQKYKNRITFA